MLTHIPRWARPPQLLVPIISAPAFSGIASLISGERQPETISVRDRSITPSIVMAPSDHANSLVAYNRPYRLDTGRDRHSRRFRGKKHNR